MHCQYTLQHAGHEGIGRSAARAATRAARGESPWYVEYVVNLYPPEYAHARAIY
eukprot:COSAG02_NODE_208_length_29027_cov_27.870230_7_plen_54_part_00